MRTLLALLLCLGLASCASWDEDNWSFPVSRAVATSFENRPTHSRGSTFASETTGTGLQGEGAQGWILVFLLMVPIVVDLAILPVTGFHDLFYVE